MHTIGNGILNPPKEIMYLNAIKHDNILSIYGFCFHPTGSCLIYQYMANGSLEDRLQHKVRSSVQNDNINISLNHVF